MSNELIPPGTELVRIETACKVLSIGRGMAYKLMTTGELESAIIGRRRLITVRSIYKLINDGIEAAAGGAHAGMGCTDVEEFGATYRRQLATEAERAVELEDV